KESPMDIEMSEKEKVSSIFADATNKVKVLQDRLQSISVQEKNKKSYPTKINCSIHDKVREDISASR
ncbi:11452_t:CDS:1, partial [Gigaspora margarita]